MAASAHWKPKVNSNGAAIDGPMIPAADVVASARPAARARSSSPFTTSPVVANLARLKNWPAAFRANTTRYMAASHSPTGRSRTGTNDSPVRPATMAARITSVRIIVDFRFHRSTKTPATGPTRANAAAVATRIPLTAAGAQDRPSARTCDTHSTSVVPKTQSPTADTAWPYHSFA